ncbi:MAG: PilZ domain-containing protein [Sphingopyxis sp.]|nr:PilZ domain-containing protein [Sphingopyxis sp.]
MNALQAHIALPEETADRRRASRRTLSLGVPATTATHEMSVVISNLSRTGLQIETDTDFAIGEIFLLVLPELGATPARVRWRDAQRFGCEFLSPVTSSAVSAALLKAPHDDDAPLPVATAQSPRDGEDIYTDHAPRLMLSAAMTILFSAVAILFLFALASLSVGAR